LRRRLTVALALVLVLAAAAAAYGHFAVPGVTVARAVRGQAVEAIYATGVVEPVTWAKVTPMGRGRILELCKCEGVAVGKGEVLARLDDAEARARLDELVARAEFLEGDMRRYARLLGATTSAPRPTSGRPAPPPRSGR
jgi:multidrug efflux pump subunit AcrA (membrane-fusion protein)